MELLPAGETVALIRTPLEVVLRRTNINSHNLYAEALLKRVGQKVTGQPGSWENGAAVIRMAALKRLGPERASQIVIADGSGMSRDNLVTTEGLARWLVSFHNDRRVGEAFIASLPIAQEDGSLKARFAGRDLQAEIRAKTGYLRQVSSLSGYVTDSGSGRRLVFSVIVNDFPAKTPLKSVKDFQEAVAILAHDALVKRAGAPNLGG
jgi:D-alanyl-D-alanine carboxypeptidase/D-alanyl-D-alanine-endopeptidase (penicillin-binding protein 4)